MFDMFFNCSFILYRRTLTFLAVIPTICPISSYESSSSHRSTIARSKGCNLEILLCSISTCRVSSSRSSKRLMSMVSRAVALRRFFLSREIQVLRATRYIHVLMSLRCSKLSKPFHRWMSTSWNRSFTSSASCENM